MTTQEQDASVKLIWRCAWFHAICELGNLELQHQKWLDPTNTNPHWSFIEFMCSYFDDLGIRDCYASALNTGRITADEFKAINEFHNALLRYNPPGGDDWDNAKILADPAWHLVVAEAKRARKRLVDLTSDPDERLILLREACGEE